ncbi:MAG TPA: cation diffusion facilitator family transporter [Polyangia bacterium]|nr:cation diffusion facilitator family transporter [Polyangia bacterium]
MSNSSECLDPEVASTAGATRIAAVRRVFIITLVLNAIVAGAKAGYGYWSHSLSLGTDSLHSILDASGNVLALLGLHWSGRPADARHPYGRRKMEIIAALGIGVLISIGMFELGLAAIDSLRGHAAPPEIGPAGFAIVVGTMIINFFVTRYEHHQAHDLKSSLLHADAEHTRSDLYASAAVLVSFIAIRAGLRWADGVATLLLVFLVGHVAWEVFRENVPVLIDAAVLDPSGVIEVARDMPGVRDVHRVRSRGVHHAVELDLHLRVASEMSLKDAHALSRRVQSELRVKFPELSDVVIHVEPAEDSHPKS